MSEWQPIETAPKDEWLLAYNPLGGVYVTKHKDGHWPMCGWNGGTEAMQGMWYPVPTHWMPLPEPPA